jgi:cation:H+ antiporter
MLQDLALWMNVAVFAVAAGVVWFAGTRVAGYADRIQSATGAGEALLGMLLLGMITALPETAVALTASWSGNAGLAVNNLLGGMAFNVAILAAADAAVRGETLSAAVASRTPLLQGVLLILLLAVVAGATLGQSGSLLGIGAWSWLILGLYLGSLVLVQRREARGNAGEQRRAAGRAPLGRLAGKTALGAAAILAAGYALARTGEALAQQTGLGSSFFGAVFLAIATSLPEITLVFSAVRLGRYAMAMGNIFGANLLGLALLFVVDAAYREGPVLSAAGGFATFAALLGIAVTALFLIGLLERGHRMVLRMGADSLLVLATYCGGIAVLYQLR